jgi:hypothetical protein
MEYSTPHFTSSMLSRLEVENILQTHWHVCSRSRLPYRAEPRQDMYFGGQANSKTSVWSETQTPKMGGAYLFSGFVVRGERLMMR